MIDGSTQSPGVRLEAIRTLRIEAWRRFAAIAAGEEPYPNIVYSGALLSSVRARYMACQRGAMFLSMHHSTYFLMLLLAADFGLPVKVVTSTEGVEFWRANQTLFPNLVTFTSKLSARDLADCRRQTCLPFFMFDTHIPNLDETYAPFRGRSIRLSASWARLAARLNLDVIAIAVDHAPDHARVMMEHLPGSEEPYDLVLAAAAQFDDFLGEDDTRWEMAPIFTSGACLGDWSDTAYQAELLRLAGSDLTSRRTLVALLKKEARLVA